MAQPSRQQNNQSKLDSPLANHRLITVINAISFSVESLPPPTWELFDDAQVAAVLEQCEVLSFFSLNLKRCCGIRVRIPDPMLLESRFGRKSLQMIKRLK
jgi:hypothetical protein